MPQILVFAGVTGKAGKVGKDLLLGALALRLLEFHDQCLKIPQLPDVGVYLWLLGHGRGNRGLSGDR